MTAPASLPVVDARDIEAIRARAAAATPGPWGWFGNLKFNEMYLATRHSGRYFVMQFWRWGMSNAQPVFQSDNIMRKIPELAERGEIVAKDYGSREIVEVRHPDAAFIAHARQDVDTLLAEIDALRAELSARANRSGGHHASETV